MDDNYFLKADYYTNSFLTDLQNAQNSTASNNPFVAESEDGKLEVLTYDNINKNTLYNAAFSHTRSLLKAEEYQDDFYGLPFKVRTHLLIPDYLIVDLVNTKENTEKDFIKSIIDSDYDRRLFIYMNIFSVDQAIFIGCNNGTQPKIFNHYIKENDTIWLSGKNKTENLISLLKSLI